MDILIHIFFVDVGDTGSNSCGRRQKNVAVIIPSFLT
jgi:hypothetical protein